MEQSKKVLFDRIIEYYKSIGLYSHIVDKFFKDYFEGKDVQVIVWHMNKPYVGKIIELSMNNKEYELLFEFEIPSEYTGNSYKMAETVKLKANLEDYQAWWWIIYDKW